MRGLSILSAGLMVLVLALAGGGQAREETPPCARRAPEADEAGIKAEPGVAVRTGCMLTILADGKPLATFTDLGDPTDFDHPPGEVHVSWRFLRSVELTEKDGTKRRGYIVGWGVYESHGEELLDPDGRLWSLGNGVVVLPGGRLIASGKIFDEDNSSTFQVVDWAERKVYELRGETNPWERLCQVREVKAEDDLMLACTRNEVYHWGEGYYAEARRMSDGRWQIKPTGGFDRKGEVPLSPKDAATVVLEPLPPPEIGGFFKRSFVSFGKVQ